MQIRFKALCWLLTLLLSLLVSNAVAQPSAGASGTRTESLETILRSIRSLNRELSSKQDEMRSLAGEGRRDEITRQIEGIVERVNQLEANFQEIASGIDPDAFVAKHDTTTVDWSKDLQEILSPVVNEVRRLTRRPREIDRLRSGIEEYEGQLLLIEQAKQNVQQHLTSSASPELAQHLSAALQNFDVKRQAILTQLDISRQKLDSKLAERKTLSESVQNIFQLFFKSRGVNLLVALLAAFVFWLVARRAQSLGGRFFGHSRDRGFYSRLISVLCTVSVVAGSLVVFLMALYFVGDWVLLIITLTLILGVIWTSKQAVHQFWTHAALLLNVGSVREGERLIYLGLPWKVESLNFYSHLTNPALTGGDLYLPIRDMANLRSRSFAPDERWFPTQVGDWLRFSDGTLAKVLHQSIEQVRVALLGGSERLISTASFLAEAPQNLAYGFRHAVSFGLDYGLQPSITNRVPPILKAAVASGLNAAGFGAALRALTVEFEEAGASSLNIAVLADFDGGVAGDFNRLRRLVHTLCVDTCNQHGWVIPFNQMTVHFAGEQNGSGAPKGSCPGPILSGNP